MHAHIYTDVRTYIMRTYVQKIYLHPRVHACISTRSSRSYMHACKCRHICACLHFARTCMHSNMLHIYVMNIYLHIYANKHAYIYIKYACTPSFMRHQSWPAVRFRRVSQLLCAYVCTRSYVPGEVVDRVFQASAQARAIHYGKGAFVHLCAVRKRLCLRFCIESESVQLRTVLCVCVCVCI